MEKELDRQNPVEEEFNYNWTESCFTSNEDFSRATGFRNEPTKDLGLPVLLLQEKRSDQPANPGVAWTRDRLDKAVPDFLRTLNLNVAKPEDALLLRLRSA